MRMDMDTKPAQNLDSDWNELLDAIEQKKVIPVIGLGLYKVQIDSEVVSLYDYLADKILADCDIQITPYLSNKFSKACLEFLKKNNNQYKVLSKRMKLFLKDVRLLQNSSLEKLVRISNFQMFITISYDNILKNTVKVVRSNQTEVISYTPTDNNLAFLNTDLFYRIKDNRSSLVYHIFGNSYLALRPSYTEGDITSSIFKFQRDMGKDKQNPFSSKLKNSQLLFIGCDYDDWLFRFFIQAAANESFEDSLTSQTYSFIGGNLSGPPIKNSLFELPIFLERYKSKMFHFKDGNIFVSKLLEKIEGSSSHDINVIKRTEFSKKVFISFEGKDRKAATDLADILVKNNIPVWLDKSRLAAGGIVDEVIFSAIDNSPVFIAIFSKNSDQRLDNKGHIKYHIREWERAYANKITGKDVSIIPVRIDDSTWEYDRFKGYCYVNLFGEESCNEFKNLIHSIKDKLQIKSD